MYYCCGISDKGAVCDSNEDAVLINKRVFTDDHEECELEAPFIAAVADGVGGENAGEVASHMALEQLSALKDRPFRKAHEYAHQAAQICGCPQRSCKYADHTLRSCRR